MARYLLFFFSWMVLVTSCMAEITPDIIRQCKNNTAILDAGRFSTSAFCINNTGYFIADATNVADNDKINIIVNAEPNQIILPAIVTRIDRIAGIAILKVNTDQQLNRFDINDTSPLTDNMPVYIFGYTGVDYVTRNLQNANLIVSVAKTGVINPNEIVKNVPLDIQLNTGNSGGPVVNDKGQLVGMCIVNGKNIGTAVISQSTFIPVVNLIKTLSKPDVSFIPPAIADETQLTAFDINVTPILKSAQDISVEMALYDAADDKRMFKATKLTENNYQVKAVPIPGKKKSDMLELKITSDDATLTCQCKSQKFNVANQQTSLDMVNKIVFDNPPKVLLNNGHELTGTVTGLDAVEISIAEIKTKINLTNASLIRIAPAIKTAKKINYTITVKVGNEVISELTDAITFANNKIDEAVSDGFKIVEAPMEQPKINIEVPGNIKDVAVGGGGRYLIFSFVNLAKLAIFDANEAKITKQLDLPSNNVLIAASFDKFVVLTKDTGIMQRYNLLTLESELSVTLKDITDNPNIYKISMGNKSDGPIYASIANTDTNNRLRLYDIFDLNSLRKINVKLRGAVDNGQGTRNINVSDDGKVVAGCKLTSTGIDKGIFNNNQLTLKSSENNHEVTPFISYPNADGSKIYATSGLYNEDLKIIEPEKFRNKSLLPAYGNRYFFLTSLGKISVYTADDMNILFTFPELIADNVNNYNFIYDEKTRTKTYHQSIHFIPDAKLLLFIPPTMDSIILYHLDIQEQLDKSGIDYLYTISSTESGRKGQTYNYQMNVKSRRGGVVYKVENGPEGMTVTNTGLVTWPIPANYNGNMANATILYTDAIGQTRMHPIKINVE